LEQPVFYVGKRFTDAFALVRAEVLCPSAPRESVLDIYEQCHAALLQDYDLELSFREVRP
jgi:hypothetical protein